MLSKKRIENFEYDANNYQYNAIGELAKDSAGGLDTITWTIYGKVKKIVKHNGDSLVFAYDPLGNRLEKRNYHNTIKDTTLYARDAQGNILAIYDRHKDTVRLTEWDLYGSKRIGSVDTAMVMKKPAVGYGSLDSLRTYYLEGQKQYELTNHLGNVLVTISDKKIPVDTTSHGYAQYYLPVVISAQDYYPFGMAQPGRSYSLPADSSYRFGFNGMMKDNDIYGNNNAYTTEFRELDPRLGRWWTRDPVVLAFLSPYAAFNNNPIFIKDPMGNTGTGPNGEAPADPDPNNPPQERDDQNRLIADGRKPTGTKADFGTTAGNATEEKKNAKDLSLSAKGLQFIEDWESHSKDANDPYGTYTDATGNATAGFGHLLHKGAPTDEDKKTYSGYTKDQAVTLLKSDFSSREADVQNNVTVKITQSQYDALVAFQFNTSGLVGSTLLRRVNAGETENITNEQIRSAFGMWNKGTVDGVLKVVPGLTNRRNAEADVYIDKTYKGP